MSRRRWFEVAYLLLGVVFGAGWAGLLGALYLSGIFGRFVPLTVVFVVVAHALLRPIGRVERWLARGLLGADIPAPPPIGYRRAVHRIGDGWRWTIAMLRDPYGWRILIWILARGVVGPFGAALVLLVPLLMAAPVIAVARPSWLPLLVAGSPESWWPATADTSAAWWLLPGPMIGGARSSWWLLVGPLVAVGIARLLPMVAGWQRRLAVRTLGPGRREVEATALARATRAEEQVRIDQELHDSCGSGRGAVRGGAAGQRARRLRADRGL